MIKRTTYSGQLIPIGNANHYNGQQVYTDGRIVYGWTYPASQNNAPATYNDAKGFWVGEESTYGDSGQYRLAGLDLALGKKYGSRNHGHLQCYPCYAIVEEILYTGAVYSPTGAYEVEGSIIAMDETGRTATYDDYKVTFYEPGQRRTDTHGYDLTLADVIITGNGTVLYMNRAYIAENSGITYVYDKEDVQIATIEGDRVDYYYDDVTYTGDGSIEATRKLPALTAIVHTIDLTGLRSLDRLQDGILVTDDYSQATFELTQHDRDAWQLFQLAAATRIVLSAYTPDRDENGYVLYHGTYNASYTDGNATIHVSGNGYIVEGIDEDQNAYKHVYNTQKELLVAEQQVTGQQQMVLDVEPIGPYNAEPATNWETRPGGEVPATDSDGNIIYTGTYEYSYIDPETQTTIEDDGDGYIIFAQNETQVYDLQDNKVASLDLTTGDITVYDTGYTGQAVDWQTNTTGIRPATDGSGNIIYYCDRYKYTVDGITTQVDRTGMYQVSDGQSMRVFGDSDTYALYAFPQIPGDPGQLTTYEATEHTGSGTLITTIDDPVRSEKYYEVTNQGVTILERMPTDWTIGTGASISLPDMSLTLTNKEGQTVTYANDPLGLLIQGAEQRMVRPGGVHAWQDYAIYQDKALIWHPEDANTIQTRTYAGIEHCYNLAYLRNRWQI